MGNAVAETVFVPLEVPGEVVVWVFSSVATELRIAPSVVLPIRDFVPSGGVVASEIF